MKKQKVILFLVDGATLELIDMGIKEGKLKTFKHLIEKGSHGILKSVVPPASSPATPVIFTGKNPGKLGFTTIAKKDGTLVSSKDIKESTLWDMLSDKGYRSLVYNVVTTFPPKEFNGMIITSRPPSPNNIIFTHPESLASEFDFPFDILYHVSDFNSMSDEKLYRIQNEVTQKRIDIFFEILKKYDFDFSFYVLKGTDTAQHFLWHRKDLLMKYYEQIDARIKELIDMNIAENLFVISDHGFEEFGTVKFYINTHLKRMGFLVPLYGHIFSKIALKVFRTAEILVPRNTLRNAFDKFKSIQAKKRSLDDETIAVPPGINAEESVAYSDTFWGISIGKKYRNSAEYEDIREKIIDSLKNLKYNGEPVIRETYKREELFSGRYTDKLPDVAFLCYPKFHPNIMYSEELFRPFSDRKTGNHISSRNGIFIAYGTDIRKNSNEASIKQVDIVPTLLHIYGISIPRDMDGSVVKKIFNKNSSFFRKPVTYEEKSHTEHKDRLKDVIAKIKI